MQVQFEQLLTWMMKERASDLHIILKDDKMDVSFRCAQGIIAVKETFSSSLFHYLKYISHLDLGNLNVPQSGSFSYVLKGKEYYFRLSFIQTFDVQSIVLRVLNNHRKIHIDELSKEKKQNDIFKQWCMFRGGLTLFSGPTGSGKTTTLHAILETIAQNKKLKVMSLEDPIEIRSQQYLQLQVNERLHLSYEEGLKQLLRHDPDVIMIGEVRDASTAKTLISSALSGHMVFTTIHAKSCTEAVLRLLDFGVKESDLKQVLTNVINQRIFPARNGKGRVCVYEIMEREVLRYYFQEEKLPDNYKTIYDKIKEGVSEKRIAKIYAQQDVIF